MKIQIAELHQSFIWSYHHPKGKVAKQKATELGLCPFQLELGYNSGRWHTRITEKQREQLKNVGWIKKGEGHEIKWKGSHCLSLPLRNQEGQIINLLFLPEKPNESISMLNWRGFFPSKPAKEVQRLFLCQNVWDAIAIQQSGALDSDSAVLWMGSRRLTHDVKNYLQGAKKLNALICIASSLDAKTLAFVQEQFAGKWFSAKLNSLYENWRVKGNQFVVDWLKSQEWSESIKFKIIDNDTFQYNGAEAEWNLKGRIPAFANTLILSCQLRSKWSQESFLFQLDLNDELNTHQQLYFWTEKEKVSLAGLMDELKEIRKNLENYRSNLAVGRSVNQTSASLAETRSWLQDPSLWENLNDLLGDTGLVGQEKIRSFVFLLALSYKSAHKFHCILTTEEIFYGREFVQQIQSLFPEEDTYTIDVTTNKSFRHYKNPVLDQKLIFVPDYNGLTSNSSIHDFKRLQLTGNLINEIPVKNALGFVQTIKQEVRGNGASIGAYAGKKEIFTNEYRTILLNLDQSSLQTEKLIKSDALRFSGKIDLEKEARAKSLLLQAIKELKHMEVENPFASKISFPAYIPANRMLTLQLWSTINLITWLHQKQRETNGQNKLRVELGDVEKGIHLFMNAVSIQLDDLEAKERAFFEGTKKAIIKKGEERTFAFTSKWIQDNLHLSKSNANRQLRSLTDKEYLSRTGSPDQGWQYKIVDWDDQILQKMKLQKYLLVQCDPKQLGSLKATKTKRKSIVTQKSKKNVTNS